MVRNGLKVEVEPYSLHHIWAKMVEIKSAMEWWFLGM